MITILLVVLVLMLVGAIPSWPTVIKFDEAPAGFVERHRRQHRSGP